MKGTYYWMKCVGGAWKETHKQQPGQGHLELHTLID